jgi:hypothetical protein
MGGQVGLADVRLDLDDPPDAETGGIVTDEDRVQEHVPRRQRGPGKEGPVQDRPAEGSGRLEDVPAYRLTG